MDVSELLVNFPEELPISAKRQEIAELIQNNQVVVIAGETGSGKTTQLPKICLSLGRGEQGLIGHTQPRRIAARTVASRIAEELNVPLGQGVGYQVRFGGQVSEQDKIKLMTDGILLAEIPHDPLLKRYDTLIIDEAHERSLNIDFLLGYLKQILPRRPDLKLIITSATIDVERFSDYFSTQNNKAPVMEVSGRTYPVEIRYRPPVETDDDMYSGIVNAVDELQALPQRGDILVFLSGEREIRETANALRKAVQYGATKPVDVVPLYARLSLQEQNRIFQPHKGVRVVLATNVAETSITVPGIRYVIDTGLARISRYSYHSKVQRLPIEPISQASANQRSGRCGRLSDGVCIRLYSEDDFNNRPEFTDPEIVRTNLAAVILQMLQLRIGKIREFPFINPPDNRLINDGFHLLRELNAVNAEEQLTKVGRQLARFPVDPRLGAMLLAAGQGGCLKEVLVIVAALSIQDPRERPADKRQAADEKHKAWKDETSDFLSLLNLWQHFEEQRQQLSRNQFSKYCHQHFVSYLRMREWRDLHHQLHHSCRELKLRENQKPADANSIHRALLAGLLSQIGFRQEISQEALQAESGQQRKQQKGQLLKGEYLGTRNRKFYIFPGSSVFKKPPKWVMAMELLETSRLFAHQVAAIDPQWLPQLAAHLVKKSHSEPYYDARRGQVMAFERQILFGLPIVERKRVPYGKRDPKTAHEIFIRAALVENRYRGKGKFASHNQTLLEEAGELEERLRRRDILADDEILFKFYSDRLPSDIVDLAGFEHWRKQAERDNPRLLFVDKSLIYRQQPGSSEEAQFPKTLDFEGITYKLDYRFEPGHSEDGLTVTLPVEILHQTPAYRFEWLVPGLLRDKCIALVKALPKAQRRQFVPVPDFVDKALPGMQPCNRPLAECLGEQLQRHTGMKVPVSAWQESMLENFYRINYRLVDEQGALLEQSRDLDQLKAKYRDRVQASLQEVAGDSVEWQGIERWNFGELPEFVQVQQSLKHQQNLTIRAYPALVDKLDSVAIELKDNPTEAGSLSRQGVVRLMLLQHKESAKYLKKQLFRGAELKLSRAGIPSKERLVDNTILSAYREACLPGKTLPRNEAEFLKCLEGRGEIVVLANKLEQAILSLVDDLTALQDKLKRQGNNFPDLVADTRQQLGDLFVSEFPYQASFYWIQQYPRYIKAALMRYEKLSSPQLLSPALLKQLADYRRKWHALVNDEKYLSYDARLEIEKFRFMVEEYRVSLFAQQLKTAVPVSEKRLTAQWAVVVSLVTT